MGTPDAAVKAARIVWKLEGRRRGDRLKGLLVERGKAAN